jgi:hypothetical protein
MELHKHVLTELNSPEENTLLVLLPTNRIVPTTMTRMTASITAYSAMSRPCWFSRAPEGSCSFSYLLTKPGRLRQPRRTSGLQASRAQLEVGFPVAFARQEEWHGKANPQ